jgi:hypothetical protein
MGFVHSAALEAFCPRKTGGKCDVRGLAKGKYVKNEGEMGALFDIEPGETKLDGSAHHKGLDYHFLVG